MKKTTKKVVSLLTILSFLLTLVPAAVFAAPVNQSGLDLEISQDGQPVSSEVKSGSTLDFKVTGDKKEGSVYALKVRPNLATLDKSRTIFDNINENAASAKVDSKDANANGEVAYDLYEDGTHVAKTVVKVAQAQDPQDPATKPGEATPQASIIELDGGNQEVSVDDEVDVIVTLMDKGEHLTGQLPEKKSVYVWAEEETDQVSDASTFFFEKNENGKIINPTVPAERFIELKGEHFVAADGKTPKNETVKVQFARSGKYTLRAAIANSGATGITPKGLKDAKVQFTKVEPGNRVVTVTAKDADVVKAKVSYDGFVEELPNVVINNNVGTETYKASNDLQVKSTGVDVKTVTVQLFGKDGKVIGKGKEVKFETDSANVLLNKTSETTDYSGIVKVDVSGRAEGHYNLYITVDDQEFIVPVQVGPYHAADLRLIKSPEAPIATDEDFKDLSDFVRVQVTDINGNVIKGNLAADGLNNKEEIFAASASSKEVHNHIKVLDKPAASKVKADDFKLVPVRDKQGNFRHYYTVAVNKDLVEGQYSVQFFLDNGRNVTVNFEVAKFNKAKELKLDYRAETVELGADIDAPSIYFVDDKGVRKSAKNRVTLGYNGYAVDYFVKDGKNKGAFGVKSDEKYLGSNIDVTAVAEREGLVSTAHLVVAKDAKTIKFLSKQGAVNTNNRVEFQLVDADGRSVALGGNGYNTGAIVVQNVSDDKAKVSASISETGDLEERGQGVLSVTSDRPCTAEFAVYVRNNDGVYYAGNLTYTFGQKGAFDGRVVVMTIGSKDVIVDNNIVAIDAAAVISNNRTFVPFRALAEAFGAKVEWDGNDRIVTTELEGKKIVMTVDKKEYKVNDQEMTMDVAPYIANDRTMIPVRFAAEGLGFTVTPTYNTDGTTASVVFTK